MLKVNKILTALAVVGVGMGVTGAAHAQQAPVALKVQKPFRIKIGTFFPSDGTVKDALGKNFLSYGLSYDFVKTNLPTPLTLGVYLDGATKSKDDVRLSYTGIGPSVRYYFTPIIAPVRFYTGAGIGAYFLNTKEDGKSNNKSAIGGKLLAGVETTPGIFGEIDYTSISKVDDLKPSGINLSVGYRF